MSGVSQFIVAVTSSLTVLILLWLLRQVVKLRKSAERLLKEHRYLMASMQLVLTHLGLEHVMESNGKLPK